MKHRGRHERDRDATGETGRFEKSAPNRFPAGVANRREHFPALNKEPP